MLRRFPAILLTAAALVCATGPARSQQPPASVPAAETAPARTAPAAAVTPESRIQVRVFEGFTTLGPVYGARDTPLAVDVGVALATCPDGNTEVQTLDIGGWNYQVPSGCDASTSRGAIRVDAGSARSGTTPQRGAESPHVMRCDPATWRCAPAP
jgi:hypothetical protein